MRGVVGRAEVAWKGAPETVRARYAERGGALAVP